MDNNIFLIYRQHFKIIINNNEKLFFFLMLHHMYKWLLSNLLAVRMYQVWRFRKLPCSPLHFYMQIAHSMCKVYCSAKDVFYGKIHYWLQWRCILESNVDKEIGDLKPYYSTKILIFSFLEGWYGCFTQNKHNIIKVGQSWTIDFQKCKNGRSEPFLRFLGIPCESPIFWVQKRVRVRIFE